MPEDVWSLLTGLGLSPAHIVGNSYGANVALTLATKKPSAFKSLIVHEPPLFDLLMGQPSEGMVLEARKRLQAVTKLLESGNRSDGARLFVETVAFGPGEWEKLPARMKETFIANADTFLDEMRDRSGTRIDLNALSRFRMASMLSYSGKSPPFFRPIVEKVANVLPGSKLEIYPNDGHVPHNSNPAEFVKRVTGFVKSIPKQTAH